MARRIEWDSGIVAAGAAIASPIFDASDVEGLTIVANNAGAVARNITLEVIRGDETVIDTVPTLYAVPAGQSGRGVVGPQSGGALGTPPLNFAYPITLPTKVRVNLAAGGAANGRLTVFGGGRP